MDALYTIFHFIVAIGILVAIHEFGHFWVARKAGVKVIRFSIGFGKPVFSIQKNPESTEYVISAIPLGGYVRMVDEREGEVKQEDIPFAFNRQSLFARSAIVAAGPIFNLLLAIVLLWAVFMMGETGMRPIVGEIEADTIAGRAGFVEGEEILAVNDESVPTWTETFNHIFSHAMQGEQEIKVLVSDNDQIEQLRYLSISNSDAEKPKKLFEKLGLKPWTPTIKPVIGRIIENGAAFHAGLETGDLIVSADDETIEGWSDWVEYVKARPETVIALKLERQGVLIDMEITPEAVVSDEGQLGRIGAGVEVPEQLRESLMVEHSMPAGEAFLAALSRTWFYSTSTLKMMGKMLIGKASTENLSGPISIAQYAGQSAERGLVPFFRFLALVSISLGVLNLLPIPVLDGGHLMFFAIEAIKGKPVSEKVQIYFQQVGIFFMMSLMIFAVFMDIERLFQ